jgi:CDP-diacylglycerol--serine O-phosphatidyltransferase
MATFKQHAPNFITSLGLLSGCISIHYSSSDQISLAGLFILAAAFFDFMDGWVARLVNSVSPFGKQLDSLADVVSFGVAPSFILYNLMLFSLVEHSPESDFNVADPGWPMRLLLFSSFMVAIFAALRLARFNLDITQETDFRGLPTPAAALLVAGLGFWITKEQHVGPLEPALLNKWLLLALILVICFLMVSRLRMFSLKFKHYNIKGNLLRYLFLLVAAVFLLIFRLPGLVPVILLYILMSVAYSFMVPKHFSATS